MDNIETLLAAADTLSMDDLKEVCFRHLARNLNIDNVLLCWRLANTYKQSVLATKCQPQVIRTFKKLNIISRLKNVSEEMLKVILSADNLEVKSEVEVCDVLMKWLQIQTEAGREVHPDQLLPLIRWSGISVGYVNSKLLQNTILEADPASLSFLTKVTTYLMSGVQFEGLQTFHRPSTGLENCLMIVGLSNGNTTSKELYRISLQHPDKVTKLAERPTDIITTENIINSVACVVNNNVYITGAGEPLRRETWKWDVVSGWIGCTDMLMGRYNHCAAVVDTTLYVLGGWKGPGSTTLSSVEGYNTLTNKWSSAGHLVHAVYYAACVTYKNSIYVFGGIDKDIKTVSHVQVYNPAQQNCTLMDKPMTSAYDTMRAMLWETSVILLGCHNCFIYNFETQIWQERKQFKTNVHYFASVLDNSTVYIAGGGMVENNTGYYETWTHTDEMKSVSVLDIIKDKPAVWKHHAKLPETGFIDAYVNISLP